MAWIMRGGVTYRGWLALLVLFVGGCASPDASPEPYGRNAGRIVSERRAGVRNAPPPDFVRARIADGAARRHAEAHPMVPVRPPTDDEVRAQQTERGIPDARFLSDPRLAVRAGMLVADVTFLSAGVRDVHALTPDGRFTVSTTRYRVRVHAAVRAPGLPSAAGEIDIFAPVGFTPPSDPSGAAPRMLAVLGDHSLRPGFNVKVAAPVDAARSSILGGAFGAPTGAAVADVLRALAEEARMGGAT